MKSSFNVNFLCFVILCFQNNTSIHSEKALIFSAGRKIFDGISKIPGLYYFACPAELPDESEFNNIESVSRNSLFLRDKRRITKEMLVDDQFIHTAPSTTCEISYKPSMLVQRIYKFFEIGFEIYTEKYKNEIEEFKNSYSSVAEWKAKKESSRRIIRPNKQVAEGKAQNKSSAGIRPNESNLKEKTSESESDSNDHANTGEMSEKPSQPQKEENPPPWFHWIPIFQFEFDLKRCGPKKFIYRGEVGDYDSTFECSEYTVNKDLCRNVDFISIYKNENQTKLFKGLPAFRKPTNVLPSECGHTYGCLKQHQVIPHYYYHSLAAKLSTCFAANTIPVWESISNGSLKKVDQYLYAITQIWGTTSNITITTGTYGVLSFPKINSTLHRYLSVLRRKIYVDKNNEKVPVPEIIYKIVEYKKSKLEEYHVVIVTHNDPTSREMKRICHSTQLDEQYEKLLSSWQFIHNVDAESGLTYPCPMTTEVLDNLGVIRRRSGDIRLRTLFVEDFSAITDEEGGNIRAFDKIKKLFDEIF